MLTPISPDVPLARPNIDRHVERINPFLAAPWTEYERHEGRSFSMSSAPLAEREAVAKLYADAGWTVRPEDDALVFHPRSVRC